MDKRPQVRDCRTPSLQRAGWMLGGGNAAYLARGLQSLAVDHQKAS